MVLADNRPNYGYDEHEVTSVPGPTVDQTMSITIQYAGDNTWPVLFNGVKVGSSTPNPGFSEYSSTGLESTSSSNVLDRYETSNNFHTAIPVRGRGTVAGALVRTSSQILLRTLYGIPSTTNCTTI